MTRLCGKCVGKFEGNLVFHVESEFHNLRPIMLDCKNTPQVENICVYGKQVEILADITTAEFRRHKHWYTRELDNKILWLHLDKVYRCRLTDPASFIGN